MTSRSHQAPLPQDQDRTERNHAEYIQAEYVEGEPLVEMVYKDLAACRISIDACRDLIHYLRSQDTPTSYRLEDILTVKGQRTGDAANRAARIAAVSQTKHGQTKSL